MGSKGFTLSEILLAGALLLVAVLALMALATTAVRSQSKSSLHSTASLVAHQELERIVQEANDDVPPGSKTDFWDNDWTTTPWTQGTVRVGPTEFEYAVMAKTLVDQTTGAPIGTSTTPSNRVKKVDIRVWWWDSNQQNRGGYGRLSTQATKLVNE